MSTGRVARRRQRRERRERVGGIVLLVIGVVVGIVAVVALTHRSASDRTADKTVIVTHTPSPTPSTPHSTTSAPSSSHSTTPSTSASSSSDTVPVVVLNNTRITGLGERAAGELRAQGYQVSSVGNYSNNIVSTCAYYDPSVPGAQAAAEALKSKFSWIVRTKEKFAELPSGPVVLVLTSDIS